MDTPTCECLSDPEFQGLLRNSSIDLARNILTSEKFSHLCEKGYTQLIANLAALLTMPDDGYVNTEEFTAMVEDARKGYLETKNKVIN